MIDIKEIEEEIEKLENCNYTIYDVCKKLSILYIVHDHLKNKPMDMRSSAQPSMMMPGR